MNTLVAYCRPGFEHDLSDELNRLVGMSGAYGYGQPNTGSGFVAFELFGQQSAVEVLSQLDFTHLVFGRQWFAGYQFSDLPANDRITPLLQLCEGVPQCGEIFVEFPDTDSGRELATFCRKFTVPLRQALRGKGILSTKPDPDLPVLHVFMLDSSRGFVGVSQPGNHSPHYNGIQRLRFPSGAPSRSTLKLEEAIRLFLSEKQQNQWFKPGMTGVDLGACPGGWTYQLVSRGLQVQAIDNGEIDEQLMATGLVRHYAVDGFKYQPNPKPVDWLVCDMIERPDRVALLMAQWLKQGWAKRAIFNLKLPMKKRFDSYLECVKIIEDTLGGAARIDLKARHLYHDREEITLFLAMR